MPVSIGTIISAGFFNTLQTKIYNILGPAGYDGAVTSSQVAVSSIDTAAQWNKLRTDINACRSIQTGAPFTLAELPVMSVTQIIRASDVNLYEAAANLVVANYGGNLILVNGLFTDPRTVSWSGTIDNEVSITFATGVAATNFFQNSGEVRLNLSQTVNGNAQDSLWVTNLANVGSIILNKTTTTRSGNAGVPIAIGWLSLTTSYQMIFNGNRLHSGSSYTYVAVDDLYVYAKLNGSGNGLVIKTVMTNGDQGTISAGTTASYGLMKRVLDASPTFAFLAGNNYNAAVAGSGITPTLTAYNASGTTTNSTNITLTSNVSGYAFIAALPASSPAPTTANWPTLMYNVNTVPGVPIGKTIPLPNSQTAYKVYMFVEDQFGNASAVNSVAVTTN